MSTSGVSVSRASSITVILPLHLLLRDFGLINSYLAVILPQVAFQLPVTTAILRPFVQATPLEWDYGMKSPSCPILSRATRSSICDSPDQFWGQSADNGNLYIKFVGIEGTSATANGHNYSS